MPLTLPAAPTPPTIANPAAFEAQASAMLAWWVATATAMNGNVLLVGDFGLGGAGTAQPPGNNANNAVAPGLYSMTPTTANGPTGNTATLRVERSYNVVHQVATSSTGVYRRRSSDNGATWTAWVLDVERGSNANGEYIRFGDGTQICQRVSIINQVVPAVTGGSLTWTFPAPFLTSTAAVIPSVSGFATAGAAETAARYFGACAQDGGPTSSLIGYFNRTNSDETLRVSVTAIGRWF